MLKLVYIAVFLILSCNKKDEGSSSKRPAQYVPAPQSTYDSTYSNAPTTPTTYQSVTTTTVPASPTCIGANPQICEAEYSITQQMNIYRRQSGLPELTHNPYLSAVARTWSYGQAALSDISHDGFPSNRISVFRNLFPDVRMPFISAENVAMTQGRYPSPVSLGAAVVVLLNPYAVLLRNVM